MKRLKFLLVFVFLLVGTLTVFAFTNGKYHKAVFWECLKYNGPQPGSPISYENSTNWSAYFGSVSSLCRGGWELCAICFDNFSTTPSMAREVLINYYLDNGSLPLHGQTIVGYGGHLVTVYLKGETP